MDLEPRLPALSEIMKPGVTLPFLRWLPRYKLHQLPGDLIAGATVAIMVIPQGMAYALLAGLPPAVGLYASMLPAIAYGLLGSTRILVVGPTAITSVMVLGAIEPLGKMDMAAYMSLSLTLTLFLGVVYVLMGLLRMGVIVNFLNRSVIAGYVNAAALTIIFSQLQHLIGVSIPRTSSPLELLRQVLMRISETNMVTLALGAGSVAILLYFLQWLPGVLEKRGVPSIPRFIITRSGPLLVVVLTVSAVAALRLDVNAGVTVVGSIPSGLPDISAGPFAFGEWDTLLPGAIAIAFVGLMEGISTAKSLTTRRRERIDANQELFAMGAANLTSAFSGGFAVTTSISRSTVNYTAGANTGLSSVVAGLIVMLAVVLFAPLLHYLPNAALAAIILTSVIRLIDFSAVREIWRYSHMEALPFVVTFVAVFFVNIAVAIFIGVALSMALYLLRTAVPRVVELGRDDYSTVYKDARNYDTTPIRGVMILRIDESLYFANAQYLDRLLRNAVAARPEADYLVLVCSGINFIDANSLQILSDLISDLEEGGVTVYLAELKNFIYYRLKIVNFPETIGEGRLFDTTHAAVNATGRLVDEDLPIG